MTDTEGRFTWHELRTDDVPAAKDFYRAATGWTVADSDMDGERQLLFSCHHDGQERHVAAITDTGSRGERAKGWIGYIGVGDASSALGKITELGGRVLQRATDREIGRFAIAADPQGGCFGIFQPADRNRDRGPRHRPGPGQFGWRELYTSDPAAAFDFYSTLFGWERGPAFDMGPAGPYQLFSTGGEPAGGIMRAPSWMSAIAWNPFVQVADIVNAEDRVTTAGGHVFDGLREVPGGDLTVKCVDPQGALFALTGRRT